MGKPAQRKAKGDDGRQWSDWLVDRILRLVIGFLLLLPYRLRVPAMGWFVARVAAPLAGYHKRSMEHLAYIHPDMPETERRRIALGVANNMGRTFIENYSTRDFLARNKNAEITGPGLAALEQARADGQAVILATAHFGNYEAPRAALVGRGYKIGGLYRPAKNKYFDAHYAKTMLAYGGPVFAQGPSGTTGFVRHLRAGGMLVLLFDQFVASGAHLPFLGKTAPTALSAAQLALRYNALLIPFYGIRRGDGLTFDIVLEAPVPVSDAEKMTLALNQSLEARVQAHPDQWLWIHRRWKPEVVERQRKRAAAKTRPGPAA